MSVEVQRTIATATRLFFADRIRGAVPLRSDGGAHLAKRFDPIEIGLQTGERPVWVGRKGQCKLGDRRIVIEQMHGNEHELGVGVDGSTGDAIDVLREVWTHLGDFEKHGEASIDDVPGDFAYTTTLVFVASKEYGEVLPLIRQARSGVLDKLHRPIVDDGVMFKIEIPFAVALGGITSTQVFRLEPRFTARAQDRVYFSQSPLNSDDHLSLIESLFA